MPIRHAALPALVLLVACSSGPDDFYEFNREAVPEATWDATRTVCTGFRDLMSRLQTEDDLSSAAVGEALHRVAEEYEPYYEAVPSSLSPSGVFGHVYFNLLEIGDLLKEGYPDPVQYDEAVRDVRGNCGAIDRMHSGDWPVDGRLEYVSTDGALGWDGERG